MITIPPTAEQVPNDEGIFTRAQSTRNPAVPTPRLRSIFQTRTVQRNAQRERWLSVVLPILVLLILLSVNAMVFTYFSVSYMFLPISAMVLLLLVICGRRLVMVQRMQSDRPSRRQRPVMVIVRVSAPRSNTESLDAWLATAEEVDEPQEQGEVVEECQVCFDTKPAWLLDCGHKLCKPCCIRVLGINQQCPFDRLIITGPPQRLINKEIVTV